MLRYVLLNARKHAGRLAGAEPDPASSGRWFDGWVRRVAPPVAQPEPGSPVARARTWLLRIGWRRHGLIDWEEVPGRASTSHGGSAR